MQLNIGNGGEYAIPAPGDSSEEGDGRRARLSSSSDEMVEGKGFTRSHHGMLASDAGIYLSACVGFGCISPNRPRKRGKLSIGRLIEEGAQCPRIA